MGLAQRRDLVVPGGDFAFTWEDFHAIAALVYDEVGIVLPESKANLIYSRLSKRLRARGLSSFRDYLVSVMEGDIEERRALIAAMTTNVTRFFREGHHFDHLRSHVLPGLIGAARKGERVRIWSSACSSGEEAYSIALTLLSAMPDAASHNILILASDIDPNMVATGRAGCYPRTCLSDIPGALHRPHLEIRTDRVQFSDAIKSMVRFRELNLLKDWPMRGPFQAIFCRNVMIYFDQSTQDRIWGRFATLMPAGGHLYIGHSERIVSPEFSLVAQTTYRRGGP